MDHFRRILLLQTTPHPLLVYLLSDFHALSFVNNFCTAFLNPVWESRPFYYPKKEASLGFRQSTSFFRISLEREPFTVARKRLKSKKR